MLNHFGPLRDRLFMPLSYLTCLFLLTGSIPAQETPISPPTTLLEPLPSGRAIKLGGYQPENLINSAQIVGGSNLISGAQANQIAGYLNEDNVTLTRIFSKTTGDGKTSTSFHTAADNNGRTISVMRIQYNGQQYLVGGYNPQDWTSVGQWNMSPSNTDRTSFLFNLTSDFVERQKLIENPACQNCGQFQAYNGAGYGPSFGGGFDLHADSSL